MEVLHQFGMYIAMIFVKFRWEIIYHKGITMLTSSIRHPKRGRFYSIHEWQLVACHGNVAAALILCYLEDEYNSLLDRDDKNGYVLDIKENDISSTLFFSGLSALNEPMNLLVNIGFIKITSPASPGEQPAIIKIKFEAVKINKWIDEYVQNNSQKQGLQLKLQEPEITEIFQSKTKPQLLRTSKNLFKFWQVKTNHPRSIAQDKTLKPIIDRLNGGYSEIDLALAIVGLTFSDWHMGREDPSKIYDNIWYVVKDNQHVEKFMALATRVGKYSDQKITKEYLDFISGKFSIIEQKENINTSTGNIIL